MTMKTFSALIKYYQKTNVLTIFDTSDGSNLLSHNDVSRYLLN